MTNIERAFINGFIKAAGNTGVPVQGHPVQLPPAQHTQPTSNAAAASSVNFTTRPYQDISSTVGVGIPGAQPFPEPKPLVVPPQPPDTAFMKDPAFSNWQDGMSAYPKQKIMPSLNHVLTNQAGSP